MSILTGDRTDRRVFLKGAGAATAVLAAGSGVARPETTGPRVVVVRDKTCKSVAGSKVDSAIAQKLVDKAVMDLSGKDDIAKAWGQYVSPKEKVVVKFNGLFRGATTHPEILKAVTDGMVKAGVDPENIIVFDRSDKDFKTSNLDICREGKTVLYYGTQGKYGKEVKAGPVSTKISEILTGADALVNVSFLKSHSRCGISGALKNHLGTVPNARDFHDACCKSVADLNTLDPIKKKTRICLTDGLYGVYDGGPRYSPKCRWDYHGVVASTDPVAHDTVLADIIKVQREAKGLKPYNNDPGYIARAGELGLGVCDLKKINRVSVEI
jgi:uncharacterized protein (DUF362 family)